MKTISSYCGHNVKLLKKNLNKSAILNFFSANIELVWELVFSNMHNINKFGKDTCNFFELLRPQCQVIDVQ